MDRGTDRRDFLKRSASLIAGSAASVMAAGCATTDSGGAPGGRPNVVLVMTDDQGYGDIASHGNPHIRTPNLDRLREESVRLTQFYVCPVCAPTRASLMTGRYNYRTGAVDTYQGRAMMHADEVTIAEIFRDAGYRTGIFGKWHLGDNYPLRAMDQGFEEALVHKGGGIGQPSDPPGNDYFDPILQHRGVAKEYPGYCTDIFTDKALDFIETHKDEPFFCYLATNAPHSPLRIAEEYAEPYRAMGLEDRVAKIYGMITNIDDNVGRLLAGLDRWGLRENTIFIFMTDNGGTRGRYSAGMRDGKGSVYEGGVRVPFFMRWPDKVRAGLDVDRIAAHIDVLPTLLDACEIRPPKKVSFDGKSLMPLLDGEAGDWPERYIFTQWHRGNTPEAFRASMVRSQRYKLVDGVELYDLDADPGEENNIGAEQPALVSEMRAAYTDWFEDVSATRGYAPPKIHLGTKYEDPVTLTPQDWRVPPEAVRGYGRYGHWEVFVARSGRYDITVHHPKLEGVELSEEVFFRLGDTEEAQRVERPDGSVTFRGVYLHRGNGNLEAWLGTGEERVGAAYVDVARFSAAP